tara:strand:+ start:21700 stop:21921 length:222 start_codon:yes stop_codon:yes gene_type:complete
MSIENLLKTINETKNTYKNLYKKSILEFENSIADVPSDEAKKYNEIMVQVKKATRENDIATLQKILQNLKNIL